MESQKTTLCTCQFGKVGKEEHCTVCNGYSMWKEDIEKEITQEDLDLLKWVGGNLNI